MNTKQRNAQKASKRTARARAAQIRKNQKEARRKQRIAERAGKEKQSLIRGVITPVPSDSKRSGEGAQRAKERIAPLIKKNRAAAEQANIKKGFTQAPVEDVDLTKMTNAELKNACSDRGIEFKAKATKAELIALLGGQ